MTPVIDENTEYIAHITDAMFNFIYYGQFHTVFYLPKVEGMEAPTITNFSEKADIYTVKIGGVAYWAYTKYCSTATVADDLTTKVTFVIDGETYTQSFTLSALLYAKIVLTYPESDVEAKAVANMIRYVKEARLAAGLDVSKFAELEALYTLEDYKDKSEYDDLDADYKAISDYVDSIRFMLNGSTASYVITLNENYADKVSLSVSYADGKNVETRVSESIANSIYTTNTRVYNLTQAIKITVTIPGADGADDIVVSGTYSLGAYIQAMDNDLAKSVYEFGVAADAYRAELIKK